MKPFIFVIAVVIGIIFMVNKSEDKYYDAMGRWLDNDQRMDVFYTYSICETNNGIIYRQEIQHYPGGTKLTTYINDILAQESYSRR